MSHLQPLVSLHTTVGFPLYDRWFCLIQPLVLPYTTVGIPSYDRWFFVTRLLVFRHTTVGLFHALLLLYSMPSSIVTTLCGTTSLPATTLCRFTTPTPLAFAFIPLRSIS